MRQGYKDRGEMDKARVLSNATKKENIYVTSAILITTRMNHQNATLIFRGGTMWLYEDVPRIVSACPQTLVEWELKDLRA